MANKKELKPVPELYSDTISKYPLEERVELHKLLTTGIKNEALAKKEEGQKADNLLKTIENGKQ